MTEEELNKIDEWTIYLISVDHDGPCMGLRMRVGDNKFAIDTSLDGRPASFNPKRHLIKIGNATLNGIVAVGGVEKFKEYRNSPSHGVEISQAREKIHEKEYPVIDLTTKE